MFYIGISFDLLTTLLGGPSESRNPDGTVTRTDLLGLCQYTVVRDLPSANGKKSASLGYSDCGATTNWNSGITITDRASGKTYTGLFGLDGKPDGLQLLWENDHTLIVSGFVADKLLWFKQDYFSGVRLVLRP